MENWFTIDKIDDFTYAISEYHHIEETHCYLLIGKEKALLIDTGLGVADISKEVAKLTDKKVVAVATHIHWDHIGGHRHYEEFYAHETELAWLQGEFPVPLARIKNYLLEGCDDPKWFDEDKYELFQGTPAGFLNNNDIIDIGGRSIKVLHTPGHSPGHMCFYEEKTGYLFTGDLVYKGMLYANFWSTDPEAYLYSLERIAKLPVNRVLPGHHSLDIKPEIIKRMTKAFEELRSSGRLCHGAGSFDYGDWSLLL